MPMPTPLTDDQRAAVLRLHGEGRSRNAIARETGVSASSVSRIVRAAGGTFDRVEQTELATAVRAADQRLTRAEHAESLLDDLAEGRRRMYGTDNVRGWFDGARAMQALAQAHAKLALLDRTRDDDDDLEQVVSMLGAVGRLARAAVDDQDDDQEAGP